VEGEHKFNGDGVLGGQDEGRPLNKNNL